MRFCDAAVRPVALFKHPIQVSLTNSAAFQRVGDKKVEHVHELAHGNLPPSILENMDDFALHTRHERGVAVKVFKNKLGPHISQAVCIVLASRNDAGHVAQLVVGEDAPYFGLVHLAAAVLGIMPLI